MRGARRDRLPEVPLATGGVGSIIIIIIKNRAPTSLFHIAYLLLIFSAGRNRTDICALSQRRFFSYSDMGGAAGCRPKTGRSGRREVRRGGMLPTVICYHKKWGQKCHLLIYQPPVSGNLLKKSSLPPRRRSFAARNSQRRPHNCMRSFKVYHPNHAHPAYSIRHAIRGI